LAGIAAAFVTGCALTALAFTLARKPAPPPVPPAVSEIWSGIFAPGAKVIASYTNPAFLRVGKSRTMFRYHGPLSAPSGAEIQIGPNDPDLDAQALPKGQVLRFSDSWTGTGEVLAVSRLTQLSAGFHNSFTVVPSRSLGLNDARSANVIFVGSAWVNGVLAQIGLSANPFYQTADGHITIRQPQAGEQASYANVADPATGETLASYTLVSLVQGIEAGRTVLSSAGLDTVGTWAGIDYLTTESGAGRLAAALKAANHGAMPRFFQAIVRADVIKGAASNPSLVALRALPDK
jgi:hypothetical protein